MCAIFVHYTLCFFIGNLSIEFTLTTMIVRAVRHEALVFGVKLSSSFFRNDRNTMRDFYLGNYGLMSPVFSLFSVLCGIITFVTLLLHLLSFFLI